MLTLNKLTKTFLKNTPNELHALHGLSLHLDPGEFVTIVGSNGAGKSTLFNAISGSFIVDSGSVLLGGRNITYMPEHKRAAIIGRLFQDPMKGTAPGMTIEENLALAYSRSRHRGLQIALRKKDLELFRDALAEFKMGLEDRMKTKVGLLSGGQRQALTLLMSTIVIPDLLLLDEHTAALDPATAEKVMDITERIVAKDQITTMMITHNLNQALKTGTRTIMMNAGGIVLDISGKERETMTVPELLTLYSKKSESELVNDRMLLAQK